MLKRLFVVSNASNLQLPTSWLKAVAPSNMFRASVTRLISKGTAWLNEDASLNAPMKSVTADVSQVNDMPPLSKLTAPRNVYSILFTVDVSMPERSTFNVSQYWNVFSIALTRGSEGQTRGWPPLLKAFASWNMYSRPLDIVPGVARFDTSWLNDAAFLNILLKLPDVSRALQFSGWPPLLNAVAPSNI